MKKQGCLLCKQLEVQKVHFRADGSESPPYMRFQRVAGGLISRKSMHH